MEMFKRAAATKWDDLKPGILSFLCAALFALLFNGCAGTYSTATAHPEARYNIDYEPDYYPYYPYYGYYGGAYYYGD
jgi:hypothetical protein